MNNDNDRVEFEDDKSLLGQDIKKIKIPENGIEGWFYKTIPGSYTLKKTILILAIVGILIIAIFFFALGIYNINHNL